MFHARATTSPHAPAVCTPQGTTSYAELARAARAVEATLRQRGVGAGDRLAIAALPGAGFLSAMIAAAGLGAAYVPLDVRHTSERLRAIVRRASCVCVVADDAGTAVLDTGAETLHLDHVEPVDGIAPVSGDTACGTDDAVLYAMFTSGSTGEPKGVLIDHAAVAQLVTAATTDLAIPGGAVWSWTHSPAFDYSTWETWGALLTGGCVAVPEPGTATDPEALSRFLTEQRVNVFSQTPSSFRRITADARLLDMAASGGHLTHVVFGGEGLPTATVEPWVRRHGLAVPRLANMYGITETSVHSTVHVLGEDSLTEAQVPVGRPLSGRSVTVRDAEGRPMAAGETGELFVGGLGLAVGYLDDPEATDRVFVTLPGESGEPERFYRSGDLGRVDPRTGLLYHCGRADHQVKIRGHRVAPEEVAAAISRIDGVRDCVVLALDHPVLREPRLVVYVRSDEDAAQQRTQYFLERTRALLPSYLVPSHFVRVDDLPLTANGKLDRSRLPSPWSEPADVSDTGTPPAARSVEETLTTAFAQVLSLTADEIDPDADFFALGGDSILATTVFTSTPCLRERLTLRDLFTTTTVRGLAELWHRRSSEPDGSGRSPRPATVQGRTADVLPLTRAQQGIVYEWAQSPSGAYQDGLLHHVALPCTPDDILDGIAFLSRVHPVLRARLRLEGNEGELDLTGDASVSAIGCDDSTESVEAALLRARRWIGQRRAEPMDLTAGPLFHFRVGRLRDASCTVALVAHHVVTDGWSLSVLLRDLYDLCLGVRRPDDPTAQYSGHQAVLAALPDLEARDIAALTASAGAGTPARPSLRPVFAWAVTTTGATQESCVPVDDQLIDAARAFAAAAGVPLKSVFVAAHLKATQTENAEVQSACVPVSGRPDLPGGDTCVGYFVRLRLLELAQRKDDPAEKFVRRVWDAERMLLRTRFAPLSVELAEEQGTLPPVLFNYVDFHVLNSVNSVIRSSEAFDENNFPLTIEVVSRTDEASGSTRCQVRAKGAAAPSLLEQLAAEHVKALRQLVAPYADGRNA
ncbi:MULTISPECIES: amino acid adenylation domain-containing protein [unclassified Streptomyces]|uniref:amino acid adenylation domain-containing protein n=1 Tax=unclassified Streptomyces TaxID=2593676 RepID=UPI003256685C